MQQTTNELRNTQIQVLSQLSNEATTHRSTYFTILTCLARVIVIVLITQACWKDRNIVPIRHSDRSIQKI